MQKDQYELNILMKWLDTQTLPWRPSNSPAASTATQSPALTSGSLGCQVRPSANSLTTNRTKDKLYFVQNGWVYEHPITSTSISLVPFIERFYYGLEVDPQTDNFIGLDAKDLSQPGDLVLIGTDRVALDTVVVGSSPGRAVFN